ncbi:hypothetical protein MB46_17415 [Arthrobacter alpinus]|uniref:DUF4244 domain-containing protein n=1 Tax=Arthrobacter alpinus TaxID=656366 RepID=UPI0005CAC8FE|nr:DUF4244 domain-containing protein [Arthrobacter alpinus]ALV46993.1 hypothetical protein MB46_17415 [Arthrobacter alpinus]
MNGNEAVRGMAVGNNDAAQENVSEIFPGASQNPPVVNRSPRPTRARLPWTRQAWNEKSWNGNRWARNGMETGMATAEYAIATLAAVGFAGLLVVILKSDEVRGFLLNIIRTALSF